MSTALVGVTATSVVNPGVFPWGHSALIPCSPNCLFNSLFFIIMQLGKVRISLGPLLHPAPAEPGSEQMPGTFIQVVLLCNNLP